MAKVTIVIEDAEVDGQATVTIDSSFDQPGKSYEEMTANPTQAVSAGLLMIAMVCSEAQSFRGEMIDEFGNHATLHGEN